MIEWEDYKEDCCVVVPVYKKNPVFFEQASLIQCVRILGQKYDICLAAPFGLDRSGYTSLCPGFKFKEKRFSGKFFESIDTYNQLCKRYEFYDAFNGYEYMLIYQLDCWIFDDNLEYFMSLGYDYIGAPWIKIDKEKNTATTDRCGNGGFSLRKVSKLSIACKLNCEFVEDSSVPEDVFFSLKCPEIKVCPVEVGREFSFEVGPTLLFRMNGNKLPMGCHKPFLFQFKEFWKNYIKF